MTGDFTFTDFTFTGNNYPTYVNPYTYPTTYTVPNTYIYPTQINPIPGITNLPGSFNFTFDADAFAPPSFKQLKQVAELISAGILSLDTILTSVQKDFITSVIENSEQLAEYITNCYSEHNILGRLFLKIVPKSELAYLLSKLSPPTATYWAALIRYELEQNKTRVSN